MIDPRAMRIESQDIRIPIGELELDGSLAFPAPAAGLVMFENGSSLDEVARLAGSWFLTHLAAAHAKEAS